MPFITQGKTNWKLLLIIIILAIIIGGGALWYTKRPEKPYQPVEIKKPETANWETYQWNNLELKHLSNWTVEKTYYQTPAQQANGEPPVNIGLAIFPGTKSTGNDFIAIGGYQVSCDSSENHTKCQFVSPISDFIYTDSNNPDILKVFDQIVPTLKLIEDETVNWKTYTNEEYGFEIKYPSDVNVQDDGYLDYLNGLRMSFCGGEYAKSCGIKGTAPHPEIYFFKFKKNGEEKGLYSFVFGDGKLPSDYWPFGGNPNDMKCKLSSITIDEQPGKLWDCGGGAALFAFWQREKDDSFYHMNVTFIDVFPKLKDTFNQMLSTFKFLETSPQTTPAPSIDNISPNSGPIGTVIEIRGKNFSGFEGDLDAWIENTQGVKGIIYSEAGSNGNLIKFTLKSSYCQIDTSYSGLPCSGFLNITPGTYKIYVAPWGQKSNEVIFTVTSP